MPRALVFDCDGVLVDAEQHGHLRAFNEMWREFQIPWSWSAEEYARKLAIAGGRERLASLREDTRFRSMVDAPTDDAAWRATVDAWHRRKTEIYVELVERGAISARAGARRLAEQVRTAGWQLAVVSSGSEKSVQAVLRAVFGTALMRHFVVVDGAWQVRKKPAPDPYLAAAAVMDIDPADCVVIEDTALGLAAARAAGAACVVTPTRLTAGQDFSPADLVLSSLGEPGALAATVLSNPEGLDLGRYLQLADLAELLDRRAAHQSRRGVKTVS